MSVSTDWLRGMPRDLEHIVQFYEKEEFLYPLVADFLAEGLRAGEPAIVIAVPAHRKGIAACLSEKGFDPETSKITFLDAHETLAAFMSGGMPDEPLFQQAIGEAIERRVSGSPTPCLRAYGEMVDVLWRGGNAEAAILLEELWNNLAKRYAFSLLCA